MISTIIPPTFHGNKLPSVRTESESGDRIISGNQQLFLCAVWNSFVLDLLLGLKVSATLNFFYLYQLPIPRLSKRVCAFTLIMERAARLICTAPDFDDLAKEVGLVSYQGVTEVTKRPQFRAEPDGLTAQLYGLTEAEFTHVLNTFPLVPDPVKVAAQNAYRNVERGSIR